jgi:hypothetical protein
VAMATLGEDGARGQPRASRSGSTNQPQDNPGAPQPGVEPEKPKTPAIPGLPDVGRALKGLFGG